MRIIALKSMATAMLLTLACVLHCQDIPVISAERYIEQAETELDYTDVMDQMETLFRHPVNLNKADALALLDIPMIGEARVAALLRHRERYGYLLSVYELQAVEGFDTGYIRLIWPCVTVSEPITLKALAPAKLLREGRSEMVYMMSRRIEEAAGYRYSGGKTAAYPGSPWRIALRYRFSAGDKITFNCAGEKDAGETLFREGQNIDFTSANLTLRNMGHCRTLILGDYMPAFGQGLTFGSGLSLGKSSMVMTVRRTQNGIRPFRSLNEYGFLRGIAASFGAGPSLITVFCSRNTLDAAVDSAGMVQSALQLSGYHRTASEIRNRHTLTRNICGLNITAGGKRWHIGSTFVRTGWSGMAQAPSLWYAKYDGMQASVINAGIDYSVLLGNAMFFGEYSINGNGRGLSYVNGMIAALDKTLDICLLNRRYHPQYQAPMAYAFGEYADNKNEYGTYAGLTFMPRPRWKLNMYMDMYGSPWLRYRVNSPARGRDMLAELQTAKRNQYTVYLRYRCERKMQNAEQGYGLHIRTRQSCRFHADRILTPLFSVGSRAERVWYRDGTGLSRGLLLFQDVTFKGIRHLKLSARYMYFNTDNYDARVYAFEDDVLYSFAVPAFQNRGNRYYLVCHYTLSEHMDMWLRVSQTSYTNVNTVSSGNDLINGHTVTDIKWQVRLRF